MKKLILLIFCMTFLIACNSIQDMEDVNSRYVDFLNTHDFSNDYTISLDMSSNKTDSMKMIFAKKDGHYSRAVKSITGQLLSRSFDTEHTLVTINAKNEIKKKYLGKNDERDADLRKVFTGRLELRKSKPKSYEEGNFYVEEFNLNGALYKYYFNDSTIAKVVIEGNDESIILDNINIVYTAEDYLFDK